MSLSLILLGSLYRGALDNRRVIINAILVFLVGFSHGYTLLFAEAMSIFLLITPEGFFQRLIYLAKVYVLGFCLLAFWLVPLLVFTRYTTPYHLVWTINSIKELIPPLLLPVIVLAGFGSVVSFAWGVLHFRKIGAELLLPLAYLWFGFGAALVLFIVAPRLGVVDIRYVPYGQLIGVLVAAVFLGWLGRILKRWGLSWALLCLTVLVTLVWIGGGVGPAPAWAKWNYEGFEAKASWPLFHKINQTLKGDFDDPRVVFEHSPSHNIFGSTRAFESLPLFSGRATLEGLYMQASISAPFVFYIQSEISQVKSCPFPQYSCSNMDFRRAKKRLQMFNVRDLIIRSSAAKRAIRLTPGYRLKKTIGPYEIWELTTNQNRYVVPLKFEPILYQGKAWKRVAYEWFARDDLLDVHLAFPVKGPEAVRRKFRARFTTLDNLPHIPINTKKCHITEKIGKHEILIQTNWINKPLLVKMTYHPDWHVEGADSVFLISPSFMLIYPKQHNVRLYYGPGPWDRIGQALTGIGILILLFNMPLFWCGRQSVWSFVVKRRETPPSLVPRLPYGPGSRIRRITLIIILISGGLSITWACYHVYRSDPNRIFNRSVHQKDAKEFEAARAGFRRVMKSLPSSGLARDSAYYIAICYYLEGKDRMAIKSFQELLRRYPDSNWVPEAHFHIGICFFRSGQEQKGIARMRMVVEKFPGTPWAGYAKDRLIEHHALHKPSLRSSKASIRNYLGKGIRLFNAERLEEAKSIFAKIAAQYPEFEGAPLALGTLALCYYKQGDWQGTIRQYKDLIKRYPNDRLVPEAYYHLGLCYEKTGHLEDAISAYRTTATRYPKTKYGRLAAKRLKEH